MRIYVAYKLSGTNVEKLRLRLEKISKIIEKLGHKSFIFIRDVQDWKPGEMKPEEVMERARIEMKKSDVILVVLESAEKGEGLLIESGYMKGLGKKLIVASKEDCRGFLLKGIADEVFEFDGDRELEDKLNRIFGES
ncbi:nucleoside 2-deoxyribosyltransferase domain-containing protein [archaeon]|nr:nucleoside 2-deoxyribosyltransferase domain-containing protein [archaeon]